MYEHHAPVPDKNPDTAFLLELLGGIFGFLGLGHIYAGRVGRGMIYMLLWWLYLVGSGLIISLLLSVVVGLCCIPFQLVLLIVVPFYSATTIRDELRSEVARASFRPSRTPYGPPARYGSSAQGAWPQNRGYGPPPPPPPSSVSARALPSAPEDDSLDDLASTQLDDVPVDATVIVDDDVPAQPRIVAYLQLPEGRRVRLPAQQAVFIGRHPRNHVVLSHPSVSKRHARILYVQGRYWLEDLNSTNGTRVGDRRLRGSGDRAPLPNGVPLHFGRYGPVVFQIVTE